MIGHVVRSQRREQRKRMLDDIEGFMLDQKVRIVGQLHPPSCMEGLETHRLIGSMVDTSDCRLEVRK